MNTWVINNSNCFLDINASHANLQYSKTTSCSNIVKTESTSQVKENFKLTM